MNKRFFTFTFFSLLILSLGLIITVSRPTKADSLSVSQKNICATYFTGIGCPHCAKTDPFVFGNLLSHNQNFIIIEYEIYQNKENAPLLLQFNQNQQILPESQLGIPFLIFNKSRYLLGDSTILKGGQEMINKIKENPCLLPDGSKVKFNNLDLVNLPGRPKIWTNNRILIKEGNGGSNKVLRGLIESKDLNSFLRTIDFQKIKPTKVALSGKYLEFDNAIRINNWVFQWNGNPPPIKSNITEASSSLIANTKYNNQEKENKKVPKKQSFTIAKIASLAAVDAINPCALAVLTLVLMSILTYNPGRKKAILAAGFAFVGAVIIGYFTYGIIIIKFWQVAQALAPIKLWLYKILGVAAIILGILEIKDFVNYRPGGLLTEMPLSMRPRAKQFISKITSAKGAFGIGIFVTLFLLPCTIGPYIIAGGILSKFAIFKIIPWLLIYDFIFVIPMIAIVIFVYLGFKKISNISEWREKNIKYLHLISGIIIAILGVIIALGMF